MSSEASLSRRTFLRSSAMAVSAISTYSRWPAALAADRQVRTRFQIACMTLPYAQFPLARALSGIKAAGYSYVAWATAHKEPDGRSVPVMAADAPPERAKELAVKCRDMGLEPLL